jgi:hypothetical protein
VQRGTDSTLGGIEYGAHVFAAWKSGNSTIAVSPTGESWTTVARGSLGISLQALFGREDALVGLIVQRCCFGELPDYYQTIESTDGLIWTDTSRGAQLRVIVTDTGSVTFVHNGGVGTPIVNGLFTLQTGGATTAEAPLALAAVTAIYENGVYLAAGLNGIAASADGTIWRMVLSGE